MIKSKFKRVTSLFLATLMCVTTFAGIGSTIAYAASGEKADVYMVDFPRDGDANYDGVWGHSNLTLKNGWHTGRSNFTNLKAIGSYSGNVAYCIEPGISLKVGQTMNKYDENYFNNLAANGVISGDEIRLFVGRILQYGYRGTISTSWRSQNEAAANSIAQAYATQLLIWETVIGERDANFNHVAASGCSNVKDVINAKHPLRNKIFSYYNSMVQSVQNHATIPSFCNKSSGSAKTIELEWNGSKYTTTLTDSNNVLSKYNFKASISGVSFSVNGNKLTVSMDTAPSKEFTITATKKNAVRRGVVVWSEGKHGQNSSVQDVVSYAQEVSDSINGYVKMKVSYGSCQIVKTSEDGKVDGINFTITGNGINQTVTTANGGKFQIDNLMLNLPVPEAKYHNIAVKPSEMQKEMVASLAERAEQVRGGGVDSSVDNMPIGMLVVLDSILNRITQNRAKGKNTFIFIDEIYLLFQHEYSANFLFTLWKRVRKYGAYASGITQNVDDLLQSHTARTMLANSEFIIMLNQASTDRLELAKLLNISDLQMSYITNVEAGHGLIKVGSSLVPFANKFPKNTKLYKLMTTKPGEA